MQSEVNVATIPRVIVKGKTVLRDYGVLLTNRRTIFVYVGKESVGEVPSSNLFVVGLLGGAVGASIYLAASQRAKGDSAPPPPRAAAPLNLNPNELAAGRNNFTIYHASVLAMELRKRYGEYALALAYRLPKDKVARLDASVIPPAEMYDEGRAAGLVGVEIAREYAKRVQASFLAALPPEVAQKAVWDV